jgi:hypothetical protein
VAGVIVVIVVIVSGTSIALWARKWANTKMTFFTVLKWGSGVYIVEDIVAKVKSDGVRGKRNGGSVLGHCVQNEGREKTG